MNKKNITIDTDFFDAGIEAKLKEYHTDEAMTNSGRKSESMIEHYRRASYGNSVQGSRYEYVPDNEYSYEMPPESINKLQAANSFENIISRVMANLFVRCWEEMKALLPQYSVLIKENEPKKIHQQILEDYNNVFNNDPSELQEQSEVQERNVFSRKIEHLDERKNEIIERQRKGLTLDSLSKERLNKSKSTKKQEGKIKTEENQKNEREVQSRKSYREKFLEYKHRSKSRDLGIQKSHTFTKFSTSIPYERQPQMTSFDYANQYPVINHVSSNIRNVHSASNIMENKNQILHNINELLLDREDIYQGQKYNYFINHRDSSRNMFSYETNPYQQPINSFTKMHYNTSTEFDSYQNEQEDLARAQLIQEIVDKLNFSKLRLEEIQKPKDEEQEILSRIDKLEKIILGLKQEEKEHYHPQEHHQVIHHKIEDHVIHNNQSENLELYKKFVEEIASIRSEIKDIRNIKYSEPKQIIQNDNSTSQIINEQQKLLHSYQEKFQKLMSERERQNTTVKTEKEPEVVETAKKSLFDQLVENGKNSEKKVTWNEGWQTNETTTKLNQQNVSQQNEANETVRKSRRTQHFVRDDGFEKYRYTRNQILENIGLRAQIEEEERLWRGEQARIILDRERRDEEVRMMVENVKKQRSRQIVEQTNENIVPTSDKYEKEWERYKNINYDSEESSGGTYCALFTC